MMKDKDKYRFYIRVQRTRERFIDVLEEEITRRNRELDGLLTGFLHRLRHFLLWNLDDDLISHVHSLQYKCAANAKESKAGYEEQKYFMFLELRILLEQLEQLVEE